MKLAAIQRMPLGRSLLVTAIGSLLFLTPMVIAGNHPILESAPHRCSGCEDGKCQPNASRHGHYPTTWRRWPGATEYPGFRNPKPSVSVPESQLPEPLNEVRTEKRSRSEDPLEPETGDAVDMGGYGAGGITPSEAIPPANSETDPFKTVPESELPSPTNGDPLGPGPMNTDAEASRFDNGFDDILPTEPTEPGPAADEPIPGFGDEPSDSFEDSFDFGLISPPTKPNTNASAVRSIKNRRMNPKTLDESLSSPLSGTLTGLVSGPDIDTEISRGEFSAADLIPQNSYVQPRIEVQASQVQTIGFEERVPERTQPARLPGQPSKSTQAMTSLAKPAKIEQPPTFNFGPAASTSTQKPSTTKTTDSAAANDVAIETSAAMELDAPTKTMVEEVVQDSSVHAAVVETTEALLEDESTLRNPLRRNQRQRKKSVVQRANSTVEKTQLKTASATNDIKVEPKSELAKISIADVKIESTLLTSTAPLENQSEHLATPKTMLEKHSMAYVGSRRSPRDTLRRNPLR